MTDNQHPDWQSGIREAQRDHHKNLAEIKAERERKREEEEARRERENAASLKNALAWFGIDADPTSGTHVIEQYKFWCTDYEAGPTRFRGDSGNRITFTLSVWNARPVPEHLEDIPYDYTAYVPRPNQPCEVKVSVREGEDDLAAKSHLADCLDRIDQDHAEFLVRAQAAYDTWQSNVARLNAEAEAAAKQEAATESEEIVIETKSEPTINEQMMDLLRKIVRQELEVALDY